MKCFYRVGAACVCLLLACLGLGAGMVWAEGVAPLQISELKITGDEFVVLRARQPIEDLSAFWVGYSGSETANSIVPTQQLPVVALAAGQAVLLTSDGAPACDATYVTKLSASLSDSKGTLVVRQLKNEGAASTFTTVDSVDWTKPSASAAAPDAGIDMRAEGSVANPVWYHEPGGSWRAGDFNACTLSFTATAAAPAASVHWQPADIDPPSTIEKPAAGNTAAASALPAADAGLKPPEITELLPNPAGTGNDDQDEFIELYNPNASAFDLSGFVLQSGSMAKHSFSFANGTLLPPKSFVAFMSADTNLSLSNSGSMAALLDPYGSVLSKSDMYGTAKDGMAWALAKGAWYWTSRPTPGAANVVSQTAGEAGSGTKQSSAKSAVKGSATSKTASSDPEAAAGDTLQVTPVHSWVLAAVALLAVAYGAYEYRLDLANFVARIRGNRADRRRDRQSAEGR